MESKLTATWFAGLIFFGCVGISNRPAVAQVRFQFPDEAFTRVEFWKESALIDEFLPKKSTTRIALKAWSERADVFGASTHGIWGRFIDDELHSITVLFLDSGTHFGYTPRQNSSKTKVKHRQRFRELFTKVEQRVKLGLEKLSKGIKPISATLGTSPMLTQGVTIYKSGDLFARYHRIEEQLIKVTWFRTLKEARSWIASDSTRDFSNAIETRKNNDILIKSIPILPQGDRAYCGVSALSMVTQFLGLNAETEDYAAAAGIRYGSTKGSYIREVYDAAADEAGFRLQILPTVNGQVIQQSIDAGIPIIVWRRWNQQRDFLHSVFLKKLEKIPMQLYQNQTPLIAPHGRAKSVIFTHPSPPDTTQSAKRSFSAKAGANPSAIGECA